MQLFAQNEAGDARKVLTGKGYSLFVERTLLSAVFNFELTFLKLLSFPEWTINPSDQNRVEKRWTGVSASHTIAGMLPW
jgi:hypothetical protein